tara:strand:- start:628 stop:960 length:333 start_codon:yes stop_codon:yes gene_type:complete
MDPQTFKDGYVDKMIDILDEHYRDHYYIDSRGIHNELPYPETHRVNKLSVSPVEGMNMFEVKEKYNPDEKWSALQNIRGGINFVADKFGDAIGQDYSRFMYPYIAAGGSR